MTKIPLVLINGTLGSGKTTLVKRLLTAGPLAGSFVIENEFASVNIDREALNDDHHDDVLEISGSCICCSTGEELESALAEVAGRGWTKPVLLEATGMANSVQLMQRLYMNPTFSEHYEVLSAVLLVDATETRADGIVPDMAAEMRLADLVVVNKADLEPVEAEALAAVARKLNPRAAVIATSLSELDPALIGAQSSGVEAAFVDVFPMLGGLQPETSTYAVLEVPQPLEVVAVRQALQPERFGQEVHLRRAKGFFADASGAYWHVEATAKHIDIQPLTQPKPAIIVAIGEGMTKAALKEVLGV